MNLVPLFRQQVTWAVRTGVDNRGTPEYADPTTVAGRAVPRLRDIIGKGGEVTTVSVQVMMHQEPGIGDLLNDREVVQVTGLVDIWGAIVGYQVLTR